jgi:hypothetical protein
MTLGELLGRRTSSLTRVDAAWHETLDEAAER